MADYYPLIARAIAGLDPNAPGESRRALYERARTALIAQLRSVQPPLSESEITRERLSLEEAVRKVESEAAQRAREASRPGGGSGAARGGDAFRRANAPAAGIRRPSGRAARCAAPASAFSSPLARGPSAAWPGRTTPAAQSARRCAAARRAAPAAAADSDAGCRPAATAAPRARRRPPPRPRQWRPAADAAAAARHARLPRHRRRRRRSRPRRGAGQSRRAKDLCQRAVALAGIRPARAEHGKPRRRSRRALFV